MTAYSVAAFHVITGVCVLAAVRHMSAGLWRPVDKANLLFSVMCCFAAGLAWTQAQLYQTWSIEEHAVLFRWNISFALLFFVVLPWFTAAVTGRLSLRWLIATTVSRYRSISVLQCAAIATAYSRLRDRCSPDEAVYPYGLGRRQAMRDSAVDFSSRPTPDLTVPPTAFLKPDRIPPSSSLE